VETGKYTQLRFEVDYVRIVTGEEEHYAKVPSGEIKLNGPFEIIDGGTTIITIDFNGEKSVNVTGKGEYMFKPVIKLLVEEPESIAPEIESVSPDTGLPGDTLTVSIEGSRLAGATGVNFGDNITIESYGSMSDELISANITIESGAPSGPRDVTVTTPGGTDTLSNGFTMGVLPPVITSVSPDSGIAGDTLLVDINGSNLAGTTAVSFGDNITINDLPEIADALVTANITIETDADTGSRDVTVTTPGGVATLPEGFTVTIP
jgi:hypothetical protein